MTEKYNEKNVARILFEDGVMFEGTTFSLAGDRISEIVFNTAMVGYQEVLTDPSYLGQSVVFTYPEIGNYGINDDDMESRQIFLDAIIVRSYNDYPSNFKSTKTLAQFLDEHNVLGIEGVDTRAMTLYLRERGACKAIISTSDIPKEKLLRVLKNSSNLKGSDYTKQATSSKLYELNKPNENSLNVAVIDCGIKTNILRLFEKHNCACTVFPSNIHYSEILNKNFDGLFISNGPGDPEPVHNVQEIVRKALGEIPIFGICMGHQILGQVLGLKVDKLKFGHHGVNHPIKNLETGKIEITSQNHNFVVLKDDNMGDTKVTHVNLNDDTVAGIENKKLKAFSVQYHPESAPGPQDSEYLFENFVTLMSETG